MKILERAQKSGFSDSQIALLSREDLTIQELKAVLRYFTCQPKVVDKELLVEEATKCIEYLKMHCEKVENSEHYKLLLNSFLPYFYNESDSLLGDTRKFHIFKMYQFLLLCAKKNGEEHLDWRLVNCYEDMLRHKFPVRKIELLLRPMIADETKRTDGLHWVFNNYPCLEDDYLHNGNNSLLYFLILEKSIINDFRPNNQVLKNLYNQEKHCFCFQKEEFDNYFIVENDCYGQSQYVENETCLSQKNLTQYPFIQQIANFCKNNGLKPEECNNDIFTRWRIWQLNEPDKTERIKASFNLLGQGFTTHIPAFYFSINISSNCFVTVDYREYKSIYVGADNENGWRTNEYGTNWSFMISPDGRLFSKSNRTQKYVPFTIKAFIILLKKQNICGAFMDFLLKFHKDRNVFYRDVIYDCLNTQCIIPLTFNEVAEYHNRAELMLTKYKTAANIRVNWNKRNLNLSYLIVKAYPLVEPGKSREILLQQKDIALITEGEYYGRSKDYTYQFLNSVLYRRVLEFETQMLSERELVKIEEKYRKEFAQEIHTDILSDEFEKWLAEKVEDELHGDDIKEITTDYVSMCKQSKIKVRLDVRSVKKLTILHEQITLNPNNYRKKTGKVKVPKNSNFNRLRDILPPEFEWIKTRKRLILETELQHHCVWSYAESITKDVCAIYSFTDSYAEHTKDGIPRRYTIEFCQKKDGSYYVQQVQGKYDSVNANGMKEYVQMLLQNFAKSNAKS